MTTKKRSVAADAWKVADLMLRDRFRFRFEGLPFEVRPVGRARRRNLIAAGIDRMLGRPHPTAGPLIAQVEPVDHCNLSCPQCLTRVRRGRGVGTYMDPAVFRSLVDELADSVLLMVLWMWGEPLLHPDLWEMVGYAKRAGIAVHVSTNGNVPLGSDGAERMVRSGLDSIVFAVDGATQETYERYRVGGDLETARGNVLELVAARERLGSPTPRLNMRFVIMHHNEHELEAARRWACDAGVDVFSVKTVDEPFELGDRYEPEATRYRRSADGADAARFGCDRPLRRITVAACGTVISCEYDHDASLAFGSYPEDGGWSAIWRGPVARAFRDGFHEGRNEYHHCSRCTYRGMRAEDTVIETEWFRGR